MSVTEQHEPAEALEAQGFTPEDLAEAERYGSLGPEYFASRRIAEGVMAGLGPDAFRPLVERAAGEFMDLAWDKVRDYLLSDTEQNIQGEMRRMVEQTVFALLSGKRWALEQYPLSKYHDGQSVRMAIVEHCGAALIEKVGRDEAADARYTADRYRNYRRSAKASVRDMLARSVAELVGAG